MAFENEGKGYSVNQNIHFTYKPEPDKTSLCQGDVLCITDGLIKLLKEVHPYFTNVQYKYFMVLSQSCDLVRRKNKNCRTPYITLAAVRSFSDFFEKELLRKGFIEKVNGLLLMDDKKQNQAYEFIERIYNNTEPEYFFLYKEDALDFPESMVAYLKVSIAIKSKEHYDECLQAKKIELSDEFKAKLGWLAGDMYSRVGTTDWESIKTSQSRKEMLKDELTSRCIIGNKEQIKQLKTVLNDSDSKLNKKEALEYISGIKVKTNYDKVMDIIEDTIKNSGNKISEDEKQKLMKSIRSKNKIKSLIR